MTRPSPLPPTAALVLAGALAACGPPPPSPFADASQGAGLGGAVPCYDAALADFDGDGLLDVYAGNHWAGAALLRNRGGLRFENVVAAAGIDPGGDQHGHGWGDADGDGRPDLYVALGADHGRTRKANRLYRNVDGARFVDVAEAAEALDPPGRGRGVSWMDYDGDGRLDVLVTNYRTPDALLRSRGDGTFEDRAGAAGLPHRGAVRAVWTDYDRDGRPDLLLLGLPGGLRLFRNRGDGTFRDATAVARLPRMPVVGAAFGDADGDGDLDLALSVGEEYPRGLALRDGWAAFTQVRRGMGLDVVAAAPPAFTLMSWDLPVALDDPRLELRDAGDGHHRLRWHGPHALAGRVGPRVTAATLVGDEPWRPRRAVRFYENRGDGTFARGDPFARRPPRANGAGVAWGDLDNDGDLDLYVVLSGVEGADEPDAVWLNDGRGRLAPAAALPAGDARGSGVHLADLDGDGRLDAFLPQGWGTALSRGRHRVLRNVAPARRWLQIVLVGTRSNRFGLGAWVEVEAGGRRLVRHHTGSALYAQDLPPVHVGLGDAARARVSVRWPSGVVDVVEADADGVLRVVEGEAQRR